MPYLTFVYFVPCPDIILTAAHKVNGRDPSSLTVRCGEWDTKTETEPLTHQVHLAIFIDFFEG